MEKKKNDKKSDYNEILEMVSKKQKNEININQALSHRSSRKNFFEEKSSPIIHSPSNYRGFAAVPDPFLDLINRRPNSKNRPIAKL